MKTEKAAFGAGCFWHVEESFRKIKGVIKTEVGFMGGKTKNPSYEQVCSDNTGHAEVVYIEFNPEEISYFLLLNEFWKLHDPTQLNRQGPDVGTQYRSVIFFYNEAQKKSAISSKAEEQKKHDKKVATEIKKAGKFYKAEEYHQKYLLKRGLSSCPI
jgi:peptide-methionine (S)-S-oxide reductase